MPFDLGDTVRLAAECKDPAGTLITAGGATLTVTLPDGSTVSPTVEAPTEAGRYVHDYVTEVAGRHSVRWVFTDPAAAFTDVFDVREPEPPLILSLADAKAQLNITSSRDDDEIRGWLEAVTSLVEQYTGITVRQTFTETHALSRLGARSLVLRHTPVVELTALEELSGAPIGVASLDVDLVTGVVRPVDGSCLAGTLKATYTAGRAVIPAAVAKAASIILQHLWRAQRHAARGALPGGGDDYSVSEPIPGLGYAVPNRALQLMEPFRLPPGVA